MDKIREALEMGRDFFDGFNCTCDPEVGLTCEPCARRMEFSDALRLLSAPVASDARDLVKEIEEDCFDPWRFNKEAKQYRVAFDTEDAIALVERFVAERERKAREEEREACADRAETFYRKDCGGCGEFEQWPCHVMPNDSVKSNCAHVKMLRSAIKEATK